MSQDYDDHCEIECPECGALIDHYGYRGDEVVCWNCDECFSVDEVLQDIADSDYDPEEEALDE